MVSRSFRGEGGAKGGRGAKIGVLFLYTARSMPAGPDWRIRTGGPKTHGIGISRQFTAEALPNLLLVSVHAKTRAKDSKEPARKAS